MATHELSDEEWTIVREGLLTTSLHAAKRMRRAILFGLHPDTEGHYRAKAEGAEALLERLTWERQ